MLAALENFVSSKLNKGMPFIEQKENRIKIFYTIDEIPLSKTYISSNDRIILRKTQPDEMEFTFKGDVSVLHSLPRTPKTEEIMNKFSRVNLNNTVRYFYLFISLIIIL